MNFYPPRELPFDFYGSLRVVKVVPLDSTLTMLASPETGAIRISRLECQRHRFTKQALPLNQIRIFRPPEIRQLSDEKSAGLAR
jgi:hypothetical protein